MAVAATVNGLSGALSGGVGQALKGTVPVAVNAKAFISGGAGDLQSAMTDRVNERPMDQAAAAESFNVGFLTGVANEYLALKNFGAVNAVVPQIGHKYLASMVADTGRSFFVEETIHNTYNAIAQ